MRSHIQVRAHSMRRFETGLAHFVYEIMTDHEPIVVRMANPDHWNGIPGSVYWHQRLEKMGVPLPKMLGYNLDAPFPYTILERLPGRDLGSVYHSLSQSEKITIARRVAAIQDIVAALPQANAYGWLDQYENPQKPYENWRAVLESGLIEAQEHIARIGLFDPAWVGRVREAATAYTSYFKEIPPAPFLDDTTTKNVLVHNGSFSGIVDVDHVCFGDRLDVLALTHMALLSMDAETSYIDAWANAWQLDAFQLRVMNLYTAMHGVYFMSEIGRKFNRETPEPASEEMIARLNRVIPMLLAHS